MIVFFNAFRYLRIHDDRIKRLWFLWGPDSGPSNKTPAKCGCIGGCAFFGSNRNGPRFFKPTRQVALEGVNTASFRYLTDILSIVSCELPKLACLMFKIEYFPCSG